MKPLPRGIFPPVVTPFKKELFDREGFLSNLGRLNEVELTGYVVLGSNGESVYLDEDEAAAVLEAAVEGAAENKFLIAGTGRESTRQTVEFTRRAAKLGAGAALVVPPAYYRGAMTDSALEFHYRSVADAAEIPVLLYHVPKFSPVVFSPRLVSSLTTHPNILGIKDTSGDLTLLQIILKERPERFRVYAGTANLLLAAPPGSTGHSGLSPKPASSAVSVIAFPARFVREHRKSGVG